MSRAPDNPDPKHDTPVTNSPSSDQLFWREMYRAATIVVAAIKRYKLSSDITIQVHDDRHAR